MGNVLDVHFTSRFKDLHKHISSAPEEWSNVIKAPHVEPNMFPEPYNHLRETPWLTLLKCLRPDLLVAEVREFIRRHLGEEFINPPPFDMESSFELSSPRTPLIFLIVAGSDPIEDILWLAKSRQMVDKCKLLSLGEECGERTIKILEDSIQMGHWVVLQNCHLSGQFLDEVEKLFMDMDRDETKSFHRDFRLWCTSDTYDQFPISMVQNSVKMTNEAPQGLKVNLQRIYGSNVVPQGEIFNSNSVHLEEEKECQKVIAGLVLFHIVAQQRRQFGSIGWNYPHEFNEADLRWVVFRVGG